MSTSNQILSAVDVDKAELATPFSASETTNNADIQTNEPVLVPITQDGRTEFSANVDGKKVLQTWSIAQNRNFWANIEGVGYKKVDDASDSSSTAFAQIFSSARTTNTTVNVVIDDATGKITQVYAW